MFSQENDLNVYLYVDKKLDAYAHSISGPTVFGSFGAGRLTDNFIADNAHEASLFALVSAFRQLSMLDAAKLKRTAAETGRKLKIGVHNPIWSVYSSLKSLQKNPDSIMARESNEGTAKYMGHVLDFADDMNADIEATHVIMSDPRMKNLMSWTLKQMPRAAYVAYLDNHPLPRFYGSTDGRLVGMKQKAEVAL